MDDSMASSPAPESLETEALGNQTPADRFFSQAIPRMLRFLIVLSVIFMLIVAIRFGVITALGFGAGAIMAYFSLRSLNKSVEGLAAHIVATNQSGGGFSLVNGFFFRYLLAGIVAYVIFTSSSQAFRGFLFGLCMPVAALLMEAGFEAYNALRHGY
jgi:hypothetical protein